MWCSLIASWAAADQTAADLQLDLPVFVVASRNLDLGRPGDGLGSPARPVPTLGQGRPLAIDGWLTDDAQPREDVPADRAAPVPPARGHPVVAALGSDPKESAGRRRVVLGRRGVGWGAVVAGSGRP
jgi:hypothetical protein